MSFADVCGLLILVLFVIPSISIIYAENKRKRAEKEIIEAARIGHLRHKFWTDELTPEARDFYNYIRARGECNASSFYMFGLLTTPLEDREQRIRSHPDFNSFINRRKAKAALGL